MIRENTGKILKYAALPGIVPRVKELFGSGFDQLAYLMAVIYAMVRLLPPAHPYLNPANVGRYGIVNVIAEAANNLVISRDNIDKIIIFIILLLGIILLVFQFFTLLLVMAAGAGVAQASPGGGNPAPPAGFGELFDTPSKATDLAHIALDMIFGVTRDGGQPFFESCVGTGQPCVQAGGDDTSLNFAGVNFPWPFHEALHTMFQLYSIGLLVIGVIIFLYFIITIVAETAQSGTPFGKRFNTVWAPIRMIVAFGLLIPMASGLNTAQYITLYAAKWGSGFATNAWERFHITLGTRDIFSGENAKLIARGATPSMSDLAMFMHFVYACKEMQIRNSQGRGFGTPGQGVFGAWMKTPGKNRQRLSDSAAAVDYFDGKTVTVVFGKTKRGLQTVTPDCGSVQIPVQGRLSDDADGPNPPGTRELFEVYLNYILQFWNGNPPGGAAFSQNVIDIVDKYYQPTPEESLEPVDNLSLEIVRGVQEDLIGKIQTIHESINDRANEQVRQRLDITREKGWAGAAIWFNEIAAMNGAFADSIMSFPVPVTPPKVMVDVRKAIMEDSESPSMASYCSVHTTGEEKLNLDELETHPEMHSVYRAICEYWGDRPVTGSFSEQDGSVGAFNYSEGSYSGNYLVMFIDYMFPVGALFDLRRDDDIHPMAKLTFLGKSIINNTLSSIEIALGATVLSNLSAAFTGMGGKTGAVAKFVTPIASGLSSMLLTFASVGLAAGFILFYILAFMPFLYFFFAFSGWLKSIFEAMVGVPLWALAHIRIDGDGLPGDAGANGYYLLLEVFLRPILILFGLLLSIVSFTALADILNEIFDLVVNNVSGTTIAADADPSNAYKKGPIDQLFFTVMYAVVLYLLATSTFKAIDLVPKSILRWIGQKDLQSFGDMQQDPLENVVQYAGIGGQQAFGQLTGGLQGFNNIK